MSTPSKLSQLRELSVVVADTGDYEAIKRLQPVDCTTNPTLVKKALDLPVYAELIERELAWGRQQTGDREAVVHAVADRLTIGVGALLSTLVPGRVSTEVDADLAHDTAATVAKARQFIQMYADAGVPREKILIKIAATWEGVEAARILQAEGIDCVRIQARCKLAGQTGVEMEALTAASVAALTIYDMIKAVDKHAVLTDITVDAKSGGKSGDWSREAANHLGHTHPSPPQDSDD